MSARTLAQALFTYAPTFLVILSIVLFVRYRRFIIDFLFKVEKMKYCDIIYFIKDCTMDTEKKSREEKVKSWRLLRIDEELRAGNIVTAATLAKKIDGVSSRTIQRDIEYLRVFYNAPIEYDPQRKTYYYTEPNFFIKSIQVTEGELFSIALLDQLLEQYRNTPLEVNLRNIFRKIVQCLPSEVTVDSSFLAENTTFRPDQTVKMEENVFHKVFSALKSRTTLKFDYRPLQKTSFMTRYLDPYHVVCQKGSWYIMGFCHDKKDVRVFNFNRMKNVSETKESFEIPVDFNPDVYFDKEIGVWLSARQKYTVDFLVSPEIGTFALERSWNANQQIHQYEDGSVLVSFETTQLPEVKRWILGQGKTVKVLNPPELIQQVKDELTAMLGMY